MEAKTEESSVDKPIAISLASNAAQLQVVETKEAEEAVFVPKLPTVVLMGILGTGKTSLYNKLTGKHDLVSGGEQSATRHASIAQSTDGAMYVIDTPGQHAHNKVLGHVAAQIGALTSLPISQIGVVADIGRIGSLIMAFKATLDIVGTDLTSLIISKSETAGSEYNREVAKKELSKALGIDEERIFFSEQDTPAEAILAFLAKSMKPAQLMSLNEEQKVALMSFCTVSAKFHQELMHMANKFVAAVHYVKTSLAICSQNDTCILLLINFLIAQHDAVKQSAFAQVVEESQHEAALFGKILVNAKLALLHAVEELTKRLSYHTLLQSHSASEYRKCGFCGLIWTKVEGCDGETFCGKRPERGDFSFDSYNRDFFQFEFVMDPFCKSFWKLQVVRREKSPSPSAPKREQSKGIGCQQHIQWRTMEPVEKCQVEHLFDRTIPMSESKMDQCTKQAEAELKKKTDRARRRLRTSITGK